MEKQATSLAASTRASWWIPRTTHVLLPGLVVAVALALVAGWRAREREAEAFQIRTNGVATRIERELVVPLAALHALHAMMQAVPEVTADQFRTFARHEMDLYPSLAALEWAQVVRREDRAAFEAMQSRDRQRPFEIREPDSNGTMGRSPERSAYPVLMRLEPHVEELVGLDIAFDPIRQRMFSSALAARGTGVSSRMRLVEDPPEVYSVVVVEPWFASPGPPVTTDVPAGLVALRGVSIAIYRLRPLIEGALAFAATPGDRFALVDDLASANDRVLYATPAGAEAPDEDELVQRHAIEVAGRTWTVVLSRDRTGGVSAALRWLAVGLGGVLVLALALGTARRQAHLSSENRSLEMLGQYTLVRPIGEGAMGQVFEATHVLLRRPAAVKLITNQNATAADLARFEREARTTSRLTHPNTVVVFDYGRTAAGDFYYVMEYLRGMDLGRLVKRAGNLPPARARHLIVQVCGAIAEAHDAGIVHRDVKPANIVACIHGGLADFAKVLDFGLAKDTGAIAKLSRIDLRVGTPAYMAPEAFLAPASVGPAADIYGIGCVLYVLLFGRDPFDGTSASEYARAHLEKAPAPPPGIDVPPELLRIALRCLAKEPEDRFRTVRQLAAQLERLDLGSWTQADAAEWWRENEPDETVTPGTIQRISVDRSRARSGR